VSPAIPADAKIHRTSDLYLAAAFLCSGIKFEGGERLNEKKVEFVFVDEVGALQQVRADYFSNRLTGDLMQFTQHVKALKSLVHSL
jgi:hypothetical protein